MSDAAQVNIGIKSTADTSGVKTAASALEALQRGAAHAGDEWEHLGKRIARKFSAADIGKEVLAGLGIGSGFALAERAAGLIEEHFRSAAEFAKSMADETERQLAATERLTSLQRTDVQNLAELQKVQAADQRIFDSLNAPKYVTRTVGSISHGEDLRHPVTEQRELTDDEEAKRKEVRKRLDDRGIAIEELTKSLKSATDAERALISEDSRYAQEVKKINDLVGQGGLTREEADKRISQLATERADKQAKETADRMKLQDDETEKIEAAQKKRNDTLTESAKKIRELADPQAKYTEQLAQIEQLMHTYTATGQPFLSAQDGAARKAQILSEMNDEAGKAIRKSREEVEAYDIALEALDKNPAYSDQEKQEKRIDLINQQTAAINRAKEALTAFMAAHPGVDVGALTEALGRFGDKKARNAGEAQPTQTLEQRDRNARADLSDPSKHYQSQGAAATGGASSFLSSIGTAADASATAIEGGLNAALTSTSDILYNVATGAMTFKQAWNSALLSVGQQFTRMATDMVAKLIWRSTVERALIALGVTTHVGGETAKTAATTVGVGTRLLLVIKESLAAVYHGAVSAFSAMASIPYVGPFLGAAAMATALALGIGLVSKIGHKDGGIITGPGGPRDDRIPAMLSNGEGVLQASAMNKFGPDFFHALNAGVLDLSSLPDSVARQLPAATYSPQDSGGSAADPSGRPIHIAVMDHRDSDAHDRFVRDPRSEAYVVRIMKKNRMVMGVKT